jgi:hypothetical protein
MTILSQEAKGIEHFYLTVCVPALDYVPVNHCGSKGSSPINEQQR